MVEPLRITCANESEIPPADALQELVTRDRHLVLQFPLRTDGSSPLPDKSGIVAALQAQLPENYNVFDSGAKIGDSTWITVKQVIPREEVLRHEQAILQAARLFRHTARYLIYRLADVLNVEISRFWTSHLVSEVPQHGKLGDGWGYFFHGLECGLGNARTGQTVEVVLGYQDEFGVLDPYFFAIFVRTTPSLAVLRGIFRDDFHDPSKALQILEERGILRRVGRALIRGSGLIAPD